MDLKVENKSKQDWAVVKRKMKENIFERVKVGERERERENGFLKTKLAFLKFLWIVPKSIKNSKILN